MRERRYKGESRTSDSREDDDYSIGDLTRSSLLVLLLFARADRLYLYTLDREHFSSFENRIFEISKPDRPP